MSTAEYLINFLIEAHYYNKIKPQYLIDYHGFVFNYWSILKANRILVANLSIIPSIIQEYISNIVFFPTALEYVPDTYIIRWKKANKILYPVASEILEKTKYSQGFFSEKKLNMYIGIDRYTKFFEKEEWKTLWPARIQSREEFQSMPYRSSYMFSTVQVYLDTTGLNLARWSKYYLDIEHFRCLQKDYITGPLTLVDHIKEALVGGPEYTFHYLQTPIDPSLRLKQSHFNANIFYKNISPSIQYEHHDFANPNILSSNLYRYNLAKGATGLYLTGFFLTYYDYFGNLEFFVHVSLAHLFENIIPYWNRFFLYDHQKFCNIQMRVDFHRWFFKRNQPILIFLDQYDWTNFDYKCMFSKKNLDPELKKTRLTL